MTASVSPPLWEDLRTDWIPDALGGAFVDDRQPPDAPGEALVVPTASGFKRIMVASVEVRVWATAACSTFLEKHERDLDNRVYGYRDALTPYRSSHALFRAQTEALRHTYAYVARTDVKGLFASVDSDALVLPDEVRDVVDRCQKLFGAPLLTGHRWSRRLANVILSQGDQAIAERPFIRWVDDYRIGGSDRDSLRSALADLQDGLRPIGLDLNASKTGIDATDELGARQEWSNRTQRDHLHAVRDGSDVAAIKNALRILADQDFWEVDAAIPQLVRRHPVLAPRAAYYLSKTRSPQRRQALLELVEHDSDWIFGRMLAVLSSDASFAQSTPKTVVSRAADHRLTAVRALAARLQWLRGEGRTRSSARVDAAFRLEDPSELLKAVPQLDTTL